MLTWRCKVYKAQGITMEKVVTSSDLVKQWSFNYEHMYVASSRIIPFDNLYLIGSFTLLAIKTDPRAIHEYQRLRNDGQLSLLTTSCTSSNSLKMALLRTTSLNKHAVDISEDNRLLQTDILCLTETHVMQDITGTNCSDQFHFYHNKSKDKFENPAFACTNSVHVVSHHQIPGKSIFSFRKLIFMEALNILLLYRKIKKKNLAAFYERLREINLVKI